MPLIRRRRLPKLRADSRESLFQPPGPVVPKPRLTPCNPMGWLRVIAKFGGVSPLRITFHRAASMGFARQVCGSAQARRSSAAPLHSWVIRYDELSVLNFPLIVITNDDPLFERSLLLRSRPTFAPTDLQQFSVESDSHSLRRLVLLTGLSRALWFTLVGNAVEGVWELRAVNFMNLDLPHTF
jgi:hypothetical protein